MWVGRERERGGAIGLFKKERHSFNAPGMRDKKETQTFEHNFETSWETNVTSHPVDICQLPSHIGTLKKSFTPLCLKAYL